MRCKIRGRPLKAERRELSGAGSSGVAPATRETHFASFIWKQSTCAPRGRASAAKIIIIVGGARAQNLSVMNFAEIQSRNGAARLDFCAFRRARPKKCEANEYVRRIRRGFIFAIVRRANSASRRARRPTDRPTGRLALVRSFRRSSILIAGRPFYSPARRRANKAGRAGSEIKSNDGPSRAAATWQRRSGRKNSI